MRKLMMAVVVLACGPAWGQTIPGITDAELRSMIDGFRSDGYGAYLGRACGEITMDEARSIHDRMDTEATGLRGSAPALVYSVYLDGLKRGKAAADADKQHACAELTPAALKRLHDLASGHARLFDSTENDATAGRIYVPFP